jgi:hypothetical protein
MIHCFINMCYNNYEIFFLGMFYVGARCLHDMMNPILVVIGCTKTVKSIAIKFINFDFFLKTTFS